MELLAGVVVALWMVLQLSSGSEGQRPHNKHPNHNYYPNGTQISTGMWAFRHLPMQNVKTDRQQQLFKVSEWGGRPDGGPEPGPTLDDRPDHPGGPPVQILPAPPHMLPPPNDNGHHKDDQKEEAEISGPVGASKSPRCAEYGRYYCNYKEDYPTDMVTQVCKYLKWPLEKLFRDLRLMKLPRMAESTHGALVCDSVTRMVRPGWARNTNGRWLVVINTDRYQQHVTEVVCRYDGAFCNFIPPCYHATCQQRFNTQNLLVVDPLNPYKGPFLAQFLFPSCCVCHVPNGKL